MATKLGKLRRSPREPYACGRDTATPHIDRVLTRIANASQLGLLLLAVFGYFYTVLPVYQKALLDEDIAKKTLELNTKESELQAKNFELAELSAAVERARETARRSQAEVGKLQGAVRGQYAELQPRLLQEFQILGSKLCKLGAIPDGSFSACIREKVLATVNLSHLRDQDRALLQRLVDQSVPEIYTGWREFKKSIEAKRQQADAWKNELAEKCAQRRASVDYKDTTKRISIDYECEREMIYNRSDVTKIDIADHYSGEEFLSAHLSGIVADFYKQIPKE